MIDPFTEAQIYKSAVSMATQSTGCCPARQIFKLNQQKMLFKFLSLYQVPSELLPFYNTNGNIKYKVLLML